MKTQKRTLLCVVAFVSFSLASYAADSVDQTMMAIRSRYAKINRDLKRYKRVERALTGYSTEGGSLVCYSLGSAPRKMVAQYLGETGKASEEYYFWNNRLFFLLRTESQYDKPFGHVVTTKQSRFYFDGGRLIRWVDARNKDVPLTRPDAQQRASRILEDARKLLTVARSQPISN
jgi:hypothetical protein